MELSRDDHELLYRNRRRPAVIRAEMMGTLLNHLDRGDGYCDVCKVLDPCDTRNDLEAALHDLNRQFR